MSKEVQQMFSSIAARYDLTNDVLSFGVHRLWKKKALNMLELSHGERVLDLCTGTGDLAFIISDKVGSVGEVVGVDFCSEMLVAANERLEKKDAKNISFKRGDVLNLEFGDSSFDVVTVAYGIRNVDDVKKGLEEIFRVLKPGGRIMVLEFGKPSLPVFSQTYQFFASCFMPIVGKILTGNKKAYQYLPQTSFEFPCGNEFLDILEGVGFQKSFFKSLFGGVSYIYIAEK